MGTKRNPGQFDCYEKAGPDEPMFVLLARDPIAPMAVSEWVARARMLGVHEDKLAEARECVRAMYRWQAAQHERRQAEARARMQFGDEEKKR